MPVYNFDFALTSEGEVSTPRPAAGADRFGLQVAASAATTGFVVVLQGSINGADWADVGEVTAKLPMASFGQTAKASPVVRYLRVVARTLTGDGASVTVHVVAK